MARQALGHVPGRGQRTRGAHEVHDFLARAQHHAEHGQLGQRGRQVLDVRAQLAAVVGARHHRASALLSAGGFRVIVGEHQRHVELHFGIGGEEVHRFRAVRQEGVDALAVVAVAGLVAQVGAGLVGRFMDALHARQRGAGYPEPAAGAGRGAAKARLLFDDQDLQSGAGRGDGRGHSGRARSHDQHVAVVLPSIFHVVSIPTYRPAGWPASARNGRALLWLRL